MKGVVLATIIVTAVLACSLASANPPLPEPIQYEQYCENQKIAGQGVIDISTSMKDKKLALEYYNVMAGDGAFELDSEHALSENASKLFRQVGDKEMPVNLYETTKMTYSGITPLVGAKYLHSKAFYGGIGADVQEMFSVNEMEKDQKLFFASTNASGHWTDPTKAAWAKGLMTPSYDEEGNVILPLSPVHLVGMDTKTSFNGTWGTDSRWHKIFYKDIKDHQMFTGVFEAEKLIKFHEAPFPEHEVSPCKGVDC